MSNQPEQRGQWGSRIGFVLAAAGSAVGLGNIWKFPYITGENGGGLFVLIYLVCIALIGVPIMMAEIMIGRAVQKQPVGAFHVLQGKRTAWSGVGWMGVICGFLLLSFYIVVAGWAMDYTLKSVVNFTKPIHEAAEIEAATARATRSIEELREMVIERDVAHETRSALGDIRNEAPPSVWEGYARFQAAMADAPGADSGRLLSDAGLAAQVERARELEGEMTVLRANTRLAVETRIDAWPEEQLLAEAETIVRRAAIFKSVQGTFVAMASDGWVSVFWASIFMLITIVIVAGGVSSGIERTCIILMPTLFVLVLVMVVYGMFKPGFGEAVSFVFKPDIGKLKASGVLEALGHAFFTLSLGMGAMITYGSYQRTKDGLASQALAISALDTVLALLACLMIFPIIFSYGQEPGAGPGLVFMSMPLAFAEIGKGGMLLAIFFFGLLVFAALTSAISLLEVVASYFIDERKWPRRRAAWVLGGVIFLVSIPSAFSMDPEFLMTGWEASFGKNFFDTIDYLVSNWMLPLGGLLIAIYAGWIMPRRLQEAEVTGMSAGLFLGWLVLVRFIAPALVIIVLAQKVGILDADEIFYGLLH